MEHAGKSTLLRANAVELRLVLLNLAEAFIVTVLFLTMILSSDKSSVF